MAETVKAAAKIQLNGNDIAQALTGKGPTVTCVLLRHMRRDGRDGKPHATDPPNDEQKRQVLEDLIDEVNVDTTPKREHVKEIVGGPFTFLGQWDGEGTVAIARRDLPSDLSKQSIVKLRQLCSESQIETKGMLEKSELVQALEDTVLPVNPHRLQPPLHSVIARGDILIMKIAETDEALDDEEEGKDVEMLSNEEFFLNYTKSEYINFASRTDIVAPEPPENEEEEDEEDEEDEQEEEDEAYDDEEDEEDGDYEIDENEMDDRVGLLNVILGGVIQKFREDNGRGPTSTELLDLRSTIATELGVELPAPLDPETKNNKRKADTEDNGDQRPTKKVKFHNKNHSREFDSETPVAEGGRDLNGIVSKSEEESSPLSKREAAS